ncbi:MAG: ABC transporter ATP-binding protein [Firmicutes bacterium]|jgi:ABC-2 type transport system ATP-binding protein|nr:ABC transporter ATP-binding protein [Bacillota bacterium]
MIVVDKLNKMYGNFQAVDDLSFRIDKGDIFGFVGHNGAGKTTTMKIISTLMKPTSGSVLVDGVDISKSYRDIRKSIGYMPDFFGVYDDLRVEEYMDFYGSVNGLSKNEIITSSNDLLELVDLVDKKRAYVNDLSRGMKQRLCLARSLIHDPKVLLLDEPASGLDPRARIQMKGILKELRNMGKTIIISSHILTELSEVCNSVGIIDGGKMVAFGKMQDVINDINGFSKMRLEVIGSPDKGVNLIREHDSVKDISIIDNVVEFSINGDELEISNILKRLVKNEIEVLTYSKIEGNLEDVYMKITKEVGEDD